MSLQDQDSRTRRAVSAALVCLGAVALTISGAPAFAQGVDEDEPKLVVDACVPLRSPHFRITEQPGECDTSREVSLVLGTEEGLQQLLQALADNEEADLKAYADFVAALLAQREELLRQLARQQQQAEAAHAALEGLIQGIASAVVSVSGDVGVLGSLVNQNAAALAGLEQDVIGVQQEVSDLREAVEAIADRDGDGVPDAEDLCPDEPGVESLHGCPVQ